MCWIKIQHIPPYGCTVKKSNVLSKKALSEVKCKCYVIRKRSALCSKIIAFTREKDLTDRAKPSEVAESFYTMVIMVPRCHLFV